MNGQGKYERGFTLLEVLITVVILAFGLLGLANLQAKLHMSEMEAYQRAQAVVLLQDFAGRVQANGTAAASYVTPAPLTSGNPLGTENTSDNCAAPATRAARDRCDWNTALLGAAETKPDGDDADTDPDPVGGMIGARGCVEQVQAPVIASCTPGIYRVSVAWQGLYETAAPDLACGSAQYGADGLRRAISTTVTIGLPKCLPP
ncbi:MAG: type IV pilus modification protein PilV [Nevskiales bacterium]